MKSQERALIYCFYFIGEACLLIDYALTQDYLIQTVTSCNHETKQFVRPLKHALGQTLCGRCALSVSFSSCLTVDQ